MIRVDCAQGGEAWFAERVGRPSASRFGEIITTQGKPSKSAEKYLYELAGERIIGEKTESYQNAAMQRGLALEPEAREFYEFARDVDVEQVGVCYPDEQKRYGASPDGLVGEDGLLEIKAPSLPVAVEYLMAGKCPTKYICQVQGQLLVTGRAWCDFVSYFPGLTPLVVRVERDDKLIAALKVALDEFCDKLDAVTEKLRGMG